MLHRTKRFISLIISLCMLLSMFTVTTFAASPYETVKDNVPVWSEPSSKSTKLYSIANQGSVVNISSQLTNSAGNPWGKTTDGNYIYMGNLTAHTHIGEATNYNVSFKSIDANYHMSDTTYDKICSCGYVVARGIGVCNKEPHVFSGNSCTLCGYTKPATHTHVAVMCKNYKTSYSNRDEYNHIATTTFDNVCSCGAVLSQGKNSSEESHSFSGNTCTKCGYTKPTTHTHVAVMCKNYKTSYSNRDEYNHIATTTFDNVCSCGAVLSQGKNSSEESHSFSGNTCTKCGYTKPTTHTHVAVMCKNYKSSYSQLNDTYHTVKTTFDNACSCGYILSQGESSTKQVHTFKSGVCTLCGYKQAAHTHIASISTLPTSEYKQKDMNYHTKIYSYGEEKCSCGKIMKEKTVSTITEKHNFNGLQCVNCGYKKNGQITDYETEKNKDILPGGVYYTAKDNVPIRKEASSSGSIVKHIKDKGTIIVVDSVMYNKEGNLWGTVSGGYFVYMGNLTQKKDDEIFVYLNGSKINFDQKPVIENGRVLVPVSGVATAMGAETSWDEKTKIVLVQRGLDTAVFKIGGTEAVGQKTIKLDSPAKIINGRTLIPLRALGEIFSCSVSWDNEKRAVYIEYSSVSQQETLAQFGKMGFYNFSGYSSSFINKNGNLSTSAKRVFTDFGSYAGKSIGGAVSYVFGKNPYTKYSTSVLKQNIGEILNNIAEAEGSYYRFSSVPSGVKNAVKIAKSGEKDLETFIKESKYLCSDAEETKILKTLEPWKNAAKTASEIVKYGNFTLDAMEIAFNDYTIHQNYLTTLALAGGRDPALLQAVLELQTEYGNVNFALVNHTLSFISDELEGDAAKGVLSAVPGLGWATFASDTLFSLSGTKDRYESFENAAAGIIIETDLMNYYSQKMSKVYNGASNRTVSGITQEKWDDAVSAFILAKAGMISIYENMEAYSTNTVEKKYLSKQKEILKSIQIVRTAPSSGVCPFYIQ